MSAAWRAPGYVDEKAVRDELTRVFDACTSCRSCIDLCAVFPTLFTMLDRVGTGDAELLTPDQQDRVVDACSMCGLCLDDCPGGSGAAGGPAVDVPRAVVRAQAMRRATGQQPLRRRRTTRLLGRADRVGRLATVVPNLVNAAVAAPPGSMRRRLLAGLTGVSPTRRLLPYASSTWSSWMRGRASDPRGPSRRVVTVYPGCVVDYQDTALGRDVVAAFERAGVECVPSAARCCGAPLLHSGEIARFARIAERNIARFRDEIRRHGDLVVVEPSCARVICREYPFVAPGADAEFVSARTHVATTRLAQVNTEAFDDATVAEPGSRCTSVVTSAVAVPDGAAEQTSPDLEACDVTEIRQCIGTDGLWSLRAEHDDTVAGLGARLRRRLADEGRDVVVADSSLAAAVIGEDDGPTVDHVIRIVARGDGRAPAV